jgi:universal stress protein A
MKPTHTKAAKAVSPVCRTKRQPLDLDLKGKKAKTLSILVPIDFSDPSRAALEFAADFARRYGGRIVLLSVIEPDPFSRFGNHPLVVTQKTFKDRVALKLSDLGRRHVGKDFVEKVLVRSGTPFEKIIETADVLKADLIIMATHGHTGLKHLLLGSTAERVIRFARCPVLTVHREAEPP